MATPQKARKAAAPRKAKARTSEAPPATEHVDNGSVFQPLQAVPSTPESTGPKYDHPYGDVPIHVFHPADGSDPIVFPQISTLPVSAKFMWQIYELNELFQSFEWMKLAKVPRALQERVIDLPNTDRNRFWASWFNNVTSPLQVDEMAPPGESSS